MKITKFLIFIVLFTGCILGLMLDLFILMIKIPEGAIVYAFVAIFLAFGLMICEESIRYELRGYIYMNQNSKRI